MDAKQVETEFGKFLALCLQGQCAQALVLARRIPVKKLKPKHATVIEKFIERFSVGDRRSRRSPSKPIQALISIYQSYWHVVLMDSKKQASAERKLFREVSQWMHEFCKVRLKSKSPELIVTRLKKEVEKLGYHCITGTVAPFHELEIWTSQKDVNYTVQLPETKEKVRVILMSRFLTKGWVAYATIGVHYPGGWAKADGLYCNTHAYDLKAEKFRVSFLAHEAQHQSDYKRFPRLGQTDLEYRAKLTEFALANKTLK